VDKGRVDKGGDEVGVDSGYDQAQISVAAPASGLTFEWSTRGDSHSEEDEDEGDEGGRTDEELEWDGNTTTIELLVCASASTSPIDLHCSPPYPCQPFPTLIAHISNITAYLTS
jgi:hypothetical protein